MNAAIIAAAGRGTRFGGDRPKQFLEINGKPVIVHTLERFENCSAIDEMVLVLSSEEIENFSNSAATRSLQKLKTIVTGGETRAESVWNGFEAVSPEVEIVAVHDGARPLVTPEEIHLTIEKANQTGAAILTAPVTDTIKEVSGEAILKTVDRTSLRRALTPQCFRCDVLRRAFAGLKTFSEATDESFLVENLGVEVSIVEGSARNIKITHSEDLVLAAALLEQFERQRAG